ncbi:MAG: anti-sigma factor [Nocardioidaceae bacterium]
MIAPDVELKLPADGGFVAVLRTATAGLAARLDFDLDEVEDLRIAVDEACALLLAQARAGSALECRFWLGDNSLSVDVAAECNHPTPPSRDSFSWNVLSALVSSASVSIDDEHLVISLTRETRSPR